MQHQLPSTPPTPPVTKAPVVPTPPPPPAAACNCNTADKIKTAAENAERLMPMEKQQKKNELTGQINSFNANCESECLDKITNAKNAIKKL